LENGVGLAANPAKARNVLARALSEEFKTEQNNLRMTSRQSGTASQGP
jgi:hypothetical protein